jgi:hypothetical protein
MRARLDITYEYEESSIRKGEPQSGGSAFTSDKLAMIPLDLIDELRDATSNGDKQLLDKLILKVGETDEVGCARALQELADKYDYEGVKRLLNEASGR